MRYRYGCMALTVALTLALTSGATRVASADPPPLAQAEAAIAVENCGLPLVAASADPPPLARTEAAIWADNCRSSLGRAHPGHGPGPADAGGDGSPTP